MLNFKKNEVYFRIKYPDKKRLYPLIDSFVFIGKNISDEDVEDVWYFQFAEGFGMFGSVLETEIGDRKVSRLTARDIADMLDLEGLVRELKDSLVRRNQGLG